MCGMRGVCGRRGGRRASEIMMDDCGSKGRWRERRQIHWEKRCLSIVKHLPHVATAMESGVWVCCRGTQTLHQCGLC